MGRQAVRGRRPGCTCHSSRSLFSKSSLETWRVLDLNGSSLWAVRGAGRGPPGPPEAQVLAGVPPSSRAACLAGVRDQPGPGPGLTASGRAAAAEAGTARRRCPRGPRPRAPAARRPRSRSSGSWRARRARPRTGTGRRWLAGTGRRPGWPARTRCRARTATGGGRPGSPRWAGRWLAGRCSGG